MSESKEQRALLRAPRLKIDRAKHHIGDLNGHIKAYLAERPFKLVIVDDPKAMQRILRVKSSKSIPDNFPMILGDAIHNLRSALDLVVFGMVGHKALRPEAVQFPFCSRDGALDSTITNRQVDLAGKRVVDEIKALKPYPGGDELLSALHALDIDDKHKLILVVGLVSDLSADQLREIEPSVPIIGPGILRFAKGAGDVFIINVTGLGREQRRAWRPSETEAPVQPAFQICFGDGKFFAHQPVIAKLQAMVARVEGVVESLATAYGI